MLRYREKEDFEARFRDVETATETWRGLERQAWSQLLDEFREKLLISLGMCSFCRQAERLNLVDRLVKKTHQKKMQFLFEPLNTRFFNML